MEFGTEDEPEKMLRNSPKGQRNQGKRRGQRQLKKGRSS